MIVFIPFSFASFLKVSCYLPRLPLEPPCPSSLWSLPAAAPSATTHLSHAHPSLPAVNTLALHQPCGSVYRSLSIYILLQLPLMLSALLLSLLLPLFPSSYLLFHALPVYTPQHLFHHQIKAESTQCLSLPRMPWCPALKAD